VGKALFLPQERPNTHIIYTNKADKYVDFQQVEILNAIQALRMSGIFHAEIKIQNLKE